MFLEPQSDINRDKTPSRQGIHIDRVTHIRPPRVLKGKGRFGLIVGVILEKSARHIEEYGRNDVCICAGESNARRNRLSEELKDVEYGNAYQVI